MKHLFQLFQLIYDITKNTQQKLDVPFFCLKAVIGRINYNYKTFDKTLYDGK